MSRARNEILAEAWPCKRMRLMQPRELNGLEQPKAAARKPETACPSPPEICAIQARALASCSTQQYHGEMLGKAGTC